MALDTVPSKSGRMTLSVQKNSRGRYNGVNTMGYGSLGRGAVRPGFLVSFLVDARGGKMRGKRHSGVDIIIPPNKVCMPTRITCKLIKKEKLIRPPVLNEGEALASRIAELGPVGEKFLGTVLIELPHFASRIDGSERELAILRSENGVSWHEHHSQTPSDALNKLIENEEEINKDKRVVRIFTADFPRYFVAVTRIRQDSKTVGSTGGIVESSVSQAVATFPEGAIGKDTKVGLQVLPLTPESVLRVLGRSVALSAVTTIEPRRRKFRAPVTLTIPIPKELQENIRKQKKDENHAVHILYSITGGSAPSQWEDITGSAPLNLVNDAVSFSTGVSARYWLMDCQKLADPTKAANEMFQSVIAPPFLAKFYFLVKRHSLKEAQVRVLCVTDDDVESTLERQERFAIIGSSADVEVFEGKPYYLHIVGNFKPVTASGQELYITFRSFRVNRLSFVAHVIDASQPPTAQLFLSKELTDPSGKRLEPPLFTLSASLPDFDTRLASPDMEPEQWRENLEAAKLSIAQDRPPVGAALKLTEVAEALQGDWVLLASHLGITPREVVKIQTEFGSAPEQAILMLHLWVEKRGGRVTAGELEKALTKIGRDDVIAYCTYDTENDDNNPDSLKQIDSSFLHQERPVVLETVQSSQSEIKPHPHVEVEEGVEYQVEDVWDGQKWHKTKIAIKKPEELTDTISPVDVVTNGNDDVGIGSALSENPHESGVEFAPAGHLAAVEEEETRLPSADEEPTPLEVKSSVQVHSAEELPSELATPTKKEEFEEPQDEIQPSDNGVTENQSSDNGVTENQSSDNRVTENQSSDNGVTGNQSEISSAGHLDTVNEPEHVQPSVDNVVAENLSEPLSFEKVSHSEPITPAEDQLKTVTPAEDQLKTVAPAEDQLKTVAPAEDQLKTVTSAEDQLKTEVETREPGDIVVAASVFGAETDEIGASSPRAVAVESEETLDSDTVTMPTVSTATEHEDSHAPSEFRAETDDISDIKTSSNISVGDPKVTTEVEEYEETLEDGTIVKSTVVKTKQEYLVTESFDSVNDKQHSHQVLSDDGCNSSSPGPVVEDGETLDNGTLKEHTISNTAEDDEDAPDPSTFRTGADDTSEDIKVSRNITVGDPKVTTEVEEFEEVGEDGSIVKRKVIKTKQEQLVTESFALSGPDHAFDSITNEQISHQVLSDNDSSALPGTVVYETEETLEDGTVVKRMVTKTTEQHIEEDETL